MADWKNGYPIGEPTSNWRRDLSYTRNNLDLLHCAFFGANFPANPVAGQRWVKDLGGGSYERYTYNGASWVLDGASAGQMVFPVVSVGESVTLSGYGGIVFVDAQSGEVLLTLPDPSTCAGRVYVVKKVDDSANYVDFVSGDLVEHCTLSNRYDYVKLVSNGTSWYRIG